MEHTVAEDRQTQFKEVTFTWKDNPQIIHYLRRWPKPISLFIYFINM